MKIGLNVDPKTIVGRAEALNAVGGLALLVVRNMSPKARKVTLLTLVAGGATVATLRYLYVNNESFRDFVDDAAAKGKLLAVRIKSVISAAHQDWEDTDGKAMKDILPGAGPTAQRS